MIRKIQSNEYLKRVDNMTAVEKKEYLGRVGGWLRDKSCLLLSKAGEDLARFQNAVQCSGGWNDAECLAWVDGVRLLSALTAVGDTGLPDAIYSISAKRAIKRLVGMLTQIHNESPGVPKETVTEKRRSDGATERRNHEFLATNHGAPARPTHIDQYVHLLPRKTQERAGLVKDLLRQMDIARENARLLMNDATAKPDDIARWSSLATNCDAEVKGIYRELDSEWEKLVKKGGVVVDDLGNARVIANDEGQCTMDEGQCTMDEGRCTKVKNSDERKAALVRKWLIDKRNAKTEAQKKKWVKKYREMIKLGGMEAVTDKVREAAEFYGVDLAKLEEKDKKSLNCK